MDARGGARQLPPAQNQAADTGTWSSMQVMQFAPVHLFAPDVWHLPLLDERLSQPGPFNVPGTSSMGAGGGGGWGGEGGSLNR